MLGTKRNPAKDHNKKGPFRVKSLEKYQAGGLNSLCIYYPTFGEIRAISRPGYRYDSIIGDRLARVYKVGYRSD